MPTGRSEWMVWTPVCSVWESCDRRLQSSLRTRSYSPASLWGKTWIPWKSTARKNYTTHSVAASWMTLSADMEARYWKENQNNFDKLTFTASLENGIHFQVSTSHSKQTCFPLDKSSCFVLHEPSWGSLKSFVWMRQRPASTWRRTDRFNSFSENRLEIVPF